MAIASNKSEFHRSVCISMASRIHAKKTKTNIIFWVDTMHKSQCKEQRLTRGWNDGFGNLMAFDYYLYIFINQKYEKSLIAATLFSLCFSYCWSSLDFTLQVIHRYLSNVIARSSIKRLCRKVFVRRVIKLSWKCAISRFN